MSIIMLVFCRDISGYFSNYDVNIWFYYFTIGERISMFLLLISVFKEVKKISWLISELLLYFLGQDIIDRVFFNVKEVRANDYVVIGILVIIAGIKMINKNEQSIRVN